jgi:hypothetical protein
MAISLVLFGCAALVLLNKWYWIDGADRAAHQPHDDPEAGWSSWW